MLLPSACLLCQENAGYDLLCSYCLQALPRIEYSCQRCGLETLSDYQQCGQCITKSPSFDRTIAAFKYDDSLSFLIQQFKFHEHLTAGKFLSQCLWQKLKACYQGNSWPEMILPVPLHKKRLQQRGFNQALELAKPIAKKIPRTVSHNNLIKNRATKAQAESSFEERKKNQRHAFSVHLPQRLPRHVAIIDDVMTTGSTVNEVATILKNNGVAQVDVWCVARAY